MKRDTANQLLPARDAFRFVQAINEIYLAAHPEVLRVLESRTMASDCPPLPGAELSTETKNTNTNHD